MAPRIRADRRQPKPEVTYRETQRYIDEHASRKETQTFTEAVKAVQNFHVEPCMSGDGNPYVALALTLIALGGFAVAPTFNAHAESPDKSYKPSEKSRAPGDNQLVKDMVEKIAKLKTDYGINMADGQLSPAEQAQLLTDIAEVKGDPTLPKYSTLNKDVGPAYSAMKQTADGIPSPPDSCFGGKADDLKNIDVPAVESKLQTKDIQNRSVEVDTSKQTRLGSNIDQMNKEIQKNLNAGDDCQNGDGIVLPSDIAPLGQSSEYSGEVQEKYVNALLAMLISLETDLTNSSKNIIGEHWSIVAGKAFSTQGERASAGLAELEAHDDPTKSYWDATDLWGGPYYKAKLNDTPVLRIISLPDGKTRNPYDGNVSIDDFSGDIIKAQLFGSSWANWDTVTGKLSGTPDRSQAGLQTLEFFVKDTWGNEADLIYTITVESDNNLPGVDNEPPAKALTRHAYEWKPIVSDADGDVLSVGLISGPEGMTYDEKTGEIKWTPNRTQVGPQNFKIAVSDGFNTVEKEYTVQSDSDNARPNVTAPSGIKAYQGQTPVLQINATDADGDALRHNVTLTKGSKKYNSILNVTQEGNNATVRIDTKGLEPGIYTLEDRVTDGYPGGEITRRTTVEILENDPPVFPAGTPAGFEVVKGKSFTYQFSATDDSGGIEYYEAIGQLPDGIHLNPDGALVGKPTREGNWNFKVAAVDEQGNSAEKMVWFKSYAQSSADGQFLMMAAATAGAIGAGAAIAAKKIVPPYLKKKKKEKEKNLAAAQKKAGEEYAKMVQPPAYLETSEPKITDVIFMHKKSGRRLVGYSARGFPTDQDIFTAMSTASHDYWEKFISESMGGRTTLGAMEFVLDNKVLGEGKVLIQPGEQLGLVVFVDGKGSLDKIKPISTRIIKELENLYGGMLDRWDGDATKLYDFKRYAKGAITVFKKDKEPVIIEEIMTREQLRPQGIETEVKPAESEQKIEQAYRRRAVTTEAQENSVRASPQVKGDEKSAGTKQPAEDATSAKGEPAAKGNGHDIKDFNVDELGKETKVDKTLRSLGIKGK